MAWVAGELCHLAEVLGVKATKKVPRASQSPKRDKVLGRQDLAGHAGKDSYPTMRRALKDGLKSFCPNG